MQSTQGHTSIQPGDYDIDPERTTIRFRTRHMFGLGPVRGTFALRSGAVSVTDPVDGSAIYAQIEAASFHTSNPQRDRTVRQRRHLDASRHPVITFAAQGAQAENTGPAAGTIAGTLTVRGVERPVTLAVSAAEPAGAEIAVTGSMHIDRYDFGLTAMRGMVGRYLDLELSAICVARGQHGAGQDGAGQDGGRHHG
jgi:polyisoprenoid-binding protein YceI